MMTLTTAPVAPLLDRLFAEADAVNPATMPSVANFWNGLTDDDEARLVRSRTDYLDLYSRMKDIPLAVSRTMGDPDRHGWALSSVHDRFEDGGRPERAYPFKNDLGRPLPWWADLDAARSAATA